MPATAQSERLIAGMASSYRVSHRSGEIFSLRKILFQPYPKDQSYPK